MLSDLIFEMFSDYSNELKPKRRMKGIKKKMMPASMYDLNKSGLMCVFNMSKYGISLDDFI